jgi:hypothetical protein
MEATRAGRAVDIFSVGAFETSAVLSGYCLLRRRWILNLAKELFSMLARLLWVPLVAVVLLGSGTISLADPPAANDVQALAGKIDALLAKRWASVKVAPAAPADDAEFLRRVYLDLAGRIPSISEARTFLSDRRTDRRARLVEQLLASPRYITHLSQVWRALLIPEAGNNFVVRLQQGSFETWLKDQVARNVGYDQMVRDLLTAPVDNQGFQAAFIGGNAPSTLAFYAAKEFKAENLAAGTARLFLGASVECAQCHNHPFSDWKREQFWEFAAFYSGMRSQKTMDVLLPSKEVAEERKITIPGTEKVVQAKFLDGSEPAWKPKTSTRTTLAEWVTSPTNSYFARATVNRVWAYFLGTGLIEPVDEVAGTITPSHPEVLDLLAREFAAHRFDVKFLIRVLTSTRAYQLSSAFARSAQDDPALFAYMPLRGLTPEQLFDSLAMATGYRDSGGGDDLRALFSGGNRSARAEFMTKFATPSERAVEAQTSILQALTLMNGRVSANATSLARSETLAAIVETPLLSTAERVETLYLATFSRLPTAQELARAVRFVDEATRDAESAARHTVQSEALADVFWALLNASEFKLNH